MIKFTDKSFKSIYEINNNYLQQKDFKRLGEFLRNYKFYNIFVEETPPSELSLTNKDFPQNNVKLYPIFTNFTQNLNNLLLHFSHENTRKIVGNYFSSCSRI